MKLITCGCCGFMGGEKELKSHSIMTDIPQCSGMEGPIRKVKAIFEDMSIVQANSDLFYEGCPKCESQLIFYKEIITPRPAFDLMENQLIGHGVQTFDTIEPAPEKPPKKPVEKPESPPPTRIPRTRTTESTTVEGVCDSCGKTFKSSNSRSGSFGGKCPSCTNQLLG